MQGERLLPDQGVIIIMTYLLSVSIGPVQDFIAAARRTADLHAGSRLLQRVVEAAAASLPVRTDQTWGVGRILPVHAGSGGSNKLLAIVEDPSQTAAAVESAARGALQEAWREAQRVMGRTALDHVDPKRAERQLAEFLEVYAAWVPVTETTYGQARLEVEQLLAGTKALRSFRQQPGDDARIPNSPLDPSRPSVITSPGQFSVPKALVGKGPLWLKSTELMDAVSLTKRALSAWGADTRLGAVLSTRELAQRSVDAGYTGDSDDEPEFPYFAVLVADGDRMGEQLGLRRSPAAHRELAEQLDRFSQAAAGVVDAAGGQLVYAGGDDVLALLPVTSVLSGAEGLANAFTDYLPAGTLSVGVAIVHYKEPLSVSLAEARDAERVAKLDRNALAIALHKRSGNPVVFAEGWAATEDDSDGTKVAALSLSRWIELHAAGLVSRSLGFSLRELSLQFPPEFASSGLLAREVRRVVQHSESDPSVAEYLPAISSLADLDRLVNLLLVSRFLTGVGRA